jgi:hypothetical protein
MSTSLAVDGIFDRFGVFYFGQFRFFGRDKGPVLFPFDKALFIFTKVCLRCDL